MRKNLEMLEKRKHNLVRANDNSNDDKIEEYLLGGRWRGRKGVISRSEL